MIKHLLLSFFLLAVFCGKNTQSHAFLNLTGFENLSGFNWDFKPTDTVSTKNHSNHIEISIKDNGNGIPTHIVDKILQPFFTTKPTGQGTGLGLSISYDIINKGHGGELEVISMSGEGSEFIIRLPLTI